MRMVSEVVNGPVAATSSSRALMLCRSLLAFERV